MLCYYVDEFGYTLALSACVRMLSQCTTGNACWSHFDAVDPTDVDLMIG